MTPHRNVTKRIALASIFALFLLGHLVTHAQVSTTTNIKGLVKFDHTTPAGMDAKIEVNLNGSLIALAAKAIVQQMPPAADLINMIDGVYVRIYEADDRANPSSGLKNMVKHYEDRLKKEKWEIVAKVNDDEDEQVQVAMLGNQEVIYGLFVSVFDSDELVLVNLVGEINMEVVGKFLENIDLKKVMQGNFDLEEFMRKAHNMQQSEGNN